MLVAPVAAPALQRFGILGKAAIPVSEIEIDFLDVDRRGTLRQLAFLRFAPAKIGRRVALYRQGSRSVRPTMEQKEAAGLSQPLPLVLAKPNTS